MSTQKEESKRLADRVQALTGEFYCTAGHHRTKGEFVMRRGRRVCARCSTRMDGRTTNKRGEG